MASIERVSVDWVTGSASIHGHDGRTLTGPIARPAGVTGLVTKSEFFPRRSRMEIVAAGSTLTMAVGMHTTKCEVPAIYLDQKDWIQFTRWHKDAAQIPAGQAAFFELLAEAADAEQVVLPLSGAHLTETSKRGGSSRIDVAVNMLRYSRGWQMRSVLALRRAELRALFGGARLTKDDVVTLTPNVVLDGVEPVSVPDDFGPEVGGLMQRMTWITVLADLLVDSDPTPDDGRWAAEQWAASFGPLAASIPGNPKARARIRELTRWRFITDLGNDLPGAAQQFGRSPEAFGDWLATDAERDFGATPGLGRLREMLHLRIANSSEKWEANDLNDWLHLSYAGAYCDLLLGERKMVNYLRRAAPRVTHGAMLHNRSQEAHADLQRLLSV